MVEPIRLLFVHSPLVGPSSWARTAACLRDAGRQVVVPALTAALEGGPPYHRRFAERAATALTGTGPVVVIAHSGAGSFVPAIADSIGDDVHGAVFVDALLPHPGQSWWQTAPPELRDELAGMVRDGRLPKWHEWLPAELFEELVPDDALRAEFVAELPAVPVAAFEEVAPKITGWPSVPCAYVRLSEAYDDMAAEAERGGWWVHREDADHLAVLTSPKRTAELITLAVDGLG